VYISAPLFYLWLVGKAGAFIGSQWNTAVVHYFFRDNDVQSSTGLQLQMWREKRPKLESFGDEKLWSWWLILSTSKWHALCSCERSAKNFKTEPATFSSWTPGTISALSGVDTEDFIVTWIHLIQDNLNPGHGNLNIAQLNFPVSFIEFLRQHWYGCAALILLCTTVAHVQSIKVLTTQRVNIYLKEYLKNKVQMGKLYIS